MAKFLSAGKMKYDLDSILSSARLRSSLEEKGEWIQNLMLWINSTERVPSQFDPSTGQIHTARVRFILQLLDRNLEWKKAVAQIFQSVIQETNALQLFCHTGLPNEVGFLQEATDRILNKIIPTPPDEKELSELFLKIFPRKEYAIWVEHLTKETVLKIQDLFLYELENKNIWDKIKKDIESAIYILTSQIHAIGLSDGIRQRLRSKNIKDSPFVSLSDSVDYFLKSYSNESAENNYNLSKQYSKKILECRKSIQEVFQHLDEFGVSVTLVYQLEKITFHLARLEVLLSFLNDFDGKNNIDIVTTFISNLIRESIEKKSLVALIQTNLNQLSRKIAERSGVTGEYYITSNKKEYLNMFKLAGGGGFLTSFTTILKYLIFSFKFPYFFEGFFSSINYSFSFLCIQLCGFTLATKQPSVTAAAMAGKLGNTQDSKMLKDFVDEVTKLTRSQFAAIFGNLVLVIPTCFILSFIYKIFTGHHFLTQEKAHETIQSISIFGPSIFYAIFTGFLLWLSSIFAGWLENWSVYRRLPEAIEKNKRLIFVVGKENAKKISNFFAKNISGFGGNVSLGFLLGMTPTLGVFFGLPIDIRHVTLSAGYFSLSVSALGFDKIENFYFISAFFGIIAIGLLNVTVSFWLALSVATRARKIQSLGRKKIRAAILKRIKSSPIEFFYPISQKKN